MIYILIYKNTLVQEITIIIDYLYKKIRIFNNLIKLEVNIKTISF